VEKTEKTKRKTVLEAVRRKMRDREYPQNML
jgi:hypothetical protein